MKTSNSHLQYWKNRSIDWKTSYFDTHSHPHRELILRSLAQFRFNSLLEIGCGAGANLLRIMFAFPHVQVGGFDINEDAIKTARQNLPKAFHLDNSPAHKIFISDKSVDVILTDACLIYIGPFMIHRVMKEIQRVARSHVVFCEFHSESLFERIKLYFKTGYFAHNYKKLLHKKGFYDIQVKKIPEKAWPDTMWGKYGYIISASL